MKAVVCKQFGPPETLVLEEVPDPKPGPGEVEIEVKAAGVTFPDALVIEDRYQMKATPPFIPGGEVAGVVASVGEGVETPKVGDRVVAGLGLTGGFAERVCVPAPAARPIPENVGFAESTGILYSYGTGYYALVDRGELKPGETLLVTGAGGNLGLAAVELGKALGARVIAAASSEEKLALCRERGADETIDYSKENLKERAKALTDGRGVDVVYDGVGGEYAEQALRAIAWKGRFLVIGFPAGIPSIPLNLTLLKSCQVIGVFLGAMIGREPETRERVVRAIDEMLVAGRLKPHVSRVYSLEEGPMALRDLQERRVVGKVVVAP
ncbi:MAG: NADPH:quinone oxidoreductase family protein [Myxococcota bacterium]|nr:NADPH:quinone oxidoreductase family protein [Myxococcota bacterium]